MSVRSPVVTMLSAALVAAVVACGAPAIGHTERDQQITAMSVDGAGVAPSRSFEVGVRKLALRRRSDRPLPTTVWYPTREPGDGPPAPGRFPIVLFSHGLGGAPEQSLAITRSWAAAGFVVAAPAYPYTKKHAQRFDRADVRHQPADAAYVLAEIMKLDVRLGDPFAGHLDTSRVGVTGYSAGGFTTSGMFVAGRDPRLRCAVVIAAGRIEGGFTGPAAPVLFVHGDEDRVVTYARGRAAYDAIRWPKVFLTLFGQGHGEYLTAGHRGFSETVHTTTDFLRWTLYGDAAAGRRLHADGTRPGVSSLLDGR